MAASPRRPSPGRSPPAAGRQLCARASRQRLQRHARAGAAGRQRHQVRPGGSMRCFCLRAARSSRRSRRCWPLAELSSGRVQFIGTGQWDYPNIGSDRALGRRLVSGARPEGLEQIRRRDTPRPMAARRRASPASPMTRSASPCRCRPIRRASATPRRSSRGRAASPASTACSACCPTAPRERGLAILEVREGGPQVIEPAPNSFATAQY